MTPAVATIQLGYSTDREALSSMTMGAACHNTDALTGGTAGMPQPCLQAAGMEGWRVIERQGRTERGCTRSAWPHLKELLVITMKSTSTNNRDCMQTGDPSKKKKTTQAKSKTVRKRNISRCVDMQVPYNILSDPRLNFYQLPLL